MPGLKETRLPANVSASQPSTVQQPWARAMRISSKKRAGPWSCVAKINALGVRWCQLPVLGQSSLSPHALMHNIESALDIDQSHGHRCESAAHQPHLYRQSRQNCCGAVAARDVPLRSYSCAASVNQRNICLRRLPLSRSASDKRATNLLHYLT